VECINLIFCQGHFHFYCGITFFAATSEFSPFVALLRCGSNSFVSLKTAIPRYEIKWSWQNELEQTAFERQLSIKGTFPS
jgi:hypothetical protein